MDELVVDALHMSTWNPAPKPGTVVHSDRGSQYIVDLPTPVFDEAGLLGSMGRAASSVDNPVVESHCTVAR